MTVEQIGTNAGEVWKAISEGNTSIKAIKKATKLKEKEIFAAVGWLAREGKVTLGEHDLDPKDLTIVLVAE
ncbi:MAG: winged helix-turn-helix domain-containing protein [Bacteroidales bacterium]|nr:winged helix-turn-helix domain-containing protein [Bacteroidales bacterium]MBD5282552.1 winged helix-turn-helix domain-containing protein [Bacteroides sp.]MDE6033911.1 winged helix-turn-helix domain-containing protein [Muribaculaceae bacterium]MBD5343099.1 winged helix-turn-helix domain-containing protein [Bacteroides sp.]MBD5353280.1 winged helix-turn-helix domain-containing protein [Bacteroides sp.]